MADGGDEERECVKIALIILGIVCAGLLALQGAGWLMFHHYWEAEPYVEPVYNLAAEIRGHEKNELPSSLDDLLVKLDPKDIEKLKLKKMYWTPTSNPVFLIKINAKFGFLINQEGQPAWITQKDLSKYFRDCTIPISGPN